MIIKKYPCVFCGNETGYNKPEIGEVCVSCLAIYDGIKTHTTKVVAKAMLGLLSTDKGDLK